KFCAAWKNKSTGFYANYTGAGSKWLNNTSYMNVDRAFSMASTLFDSEGNRLAEVAPLTGDNAHVLKNNIAFPNKLSQIGECWEYIPSQNIDRYVECPAGENNTWNLNLDLTEDDFESLDDPSMTVTGKDLSTIPGILGPRNADGSLPDVGFLKLKKGSRAIDKGEDLGFPFVGEAPDLGAFEYGMSSSRHSGLDPESSGSVVGSSSSAESVASIAMPRNGHLPGLHATRGAAIVFDLQGRLLGNLRFEQINGGDFADRDKSLAEALRAKFRNPGTYILRYGSEIRKVQVR
ncbi:MAG: pectate lyase, partial [Fibrobacter sp.]|nr:pectate lyase [Fibrobacter sp.]